MGLVKILIAITAVAGMGAAQSFALSIGNVTATKAARKVGNGFAIRAQGCDGEARLTGIIVRSTGGTRASTPLTIFPGEGKNIWGAGSNDRQETSWLAVVTAECGAARAGLIVPIDARGLYNRDKARFLAHAPTSDEIETALKELD